MPITEKKRGVSPQDSKQRNAFFLVIYPLNLNHVSTNTKNTRGHRATQQTRADTAKSVNHACAFPSHSPPRLLTDSDVRLSRGGDRSFSRLLHNGAIGLCLFVLLPPSFLSGGPAQNVGPSVARDIDLTARAPSFVIAQLSTFLRFSRIVSLSV